MRRLSVTVVLAILALTLIIRTTAAQDGPRLLAPNTTSDSNIISHAAVLSTLVQNQTLIDSPLTNNNNKAVLFFTHNWSINGIYVDEALGTWYDGSKWTIFNQDFAAGTIPENAGFNIQVQGVGGNVFIHKTTASSVAGNSSYINHPLTNGNPNALLFVTPNWTAGSIYNDYAIGVWYDEDAQQWAIFNQTTSPTPAPAMPVGAAFNVQVLTPGVYSFVHTSTETDYITVINHPYLDGNFNARFIVTQNWNPPGSDGVYNNHHIGVYYVAGKWTIFNNDQLDIPVGSAFNIHILGDAADPDELLVNGGFEVPTQTNPKIPVKWAATLTNNRRICNAYAPHVINAYAGECAALFTGKSGVKGKMTQVMNYAGSHHTVNLSLYAQGRGLTKGASIVAAIKLVDTTTKKLVIPAAQLNAGNYAYRQFAKSLSVPADITKITLTIQMVGPSGKFWVDNVSVTTSNVVREFDFPALPPAP